MNNEHTFMTFPCDFKLKIIGNNTESFVLDINVIARRHFPDLKDGAIHSQLSQQGNYLAISIDLHVQNQLTLDALYIELTQHPEIKMVL